MKNNLLKTLYMAAVLANTILSENPLCAADFAPLKDSTRFNLVTEGKLLESSSRPTHGGYTETKTRTMIFRNPEGKTYLFKVAEAELVSRLRETLMKAGLVTNSNFKIFYGELEVLSEMAAVVGTGADYLVEGSSLYTIKYND